MTLTLVHLICKPQASEKRLQLTLCSWVFSTETLPSEVNGQKLYNPAKSTTAKLVNGETWSVSYGDGSSSSGDIYTDFPFQTLAIDPKYDSHLVLVPNPSYLQGDFGLERGEALATAAELFTFGCIAVYRSAFFSDCQDGVFPMKPLWRRSMAAGRCSAQLYAGPWEDVGTPERLAALNRTGPPKS